MMNKKKEDPPVKTYFDVRVETMLPATLTYRVLAENAEQASEMIKKISPNNIKHKLNGKRDIKLTVYDYGCSVIKYIKHIIK